MKYPVYSVTIPLMVGIVCADVLHGVGDISLVHYIVAFALTTAVAVVLHFMRRPFSASLAIMMSVGCLGCVITEMRHQHISTAIAEHTHYMKGRIMAPPQQKKQTVAVELSVSGGGEIMAYIQGCTCKLEVGDVVEVFSRIGTESTFMYKDTSMCDDDGLLGRYRMGLYRRGISATCYVDSLSWRMVDCGDDMPIQSRLRRLQSEMVEAYHDAGIVAAEGAIIEAMTLGSRMNLDRELRQQYASAGASHVLALSGMHLSILYGLMSVLVLSGISNMRWRLVLRVLLLLLVWAFVMLTGMMPSLLRAAIMFTIIEMSRTVMIRPSSGRWGIDIRADMFADEMGEKCGINALGTSALIMLLCDPFLLMNVGFQLSYVSMFGIFACSGMMRRASSAWWRWKRGNGWMSRLRAVVGSVVGKLVGIVLVSAVCSIVTMPLVAYHFGIVPLLAVVTNVIITLPVGLLLVAAACWWVFTPIYVVQAVAGRAMVGLATIINDATAWVASLPWSTVEWHPSVVEVVLSYVLMVVVYRIGTIIVPGQGIHSSR